MIRGRYREWKRKKPVKSNRLMSHCIIYDLHTSTASIYIYRWTTAAADRVWNVWIFFNLTIIFVLGFTCKWWERKPETTYRLRPADRTTIGTVSRASRHCSINRSTAVRIYVTRDGHHRRDVGLPRSRFADVQRSSSGGGGLDGCNRAGAGAAVAARAGGRLSTSWQAKTPREGERDQKPFEKSQEPRRNGAASRRRIRIRRYLPNIIRKNNNTKIIITMT